MCMESPFMDWNSWIMLLLITLFCFSLSAFPWAVYASVLWGDGRNGVYVCVWDEVELISIVEHNYWRIYIVKDNLAQLGLGKSHLHEEEGTDNSNCPASSETGRDKRIYSFCLPFELPLLPHLWLPLMTNVQQFGGAYTF